MSIPRDDCGGRRKGGPNKDPPSSLKMRSSSAEGALNKYAVDFSPCEQGCDPCVGHLRMLSPHLRDSSHHPSQPTKESPNIDPQNLDHESRQADQSSSIQNKSGVNEGMGKMECSEEESESNSESDPESESDPDYIASIQSTRHVRDSSDSNSPKAKNLNPLSQEQFKCNECDKILSTNGHLTIHKRSHTGEKPYRCAECEMSFTTSGNLSTHLRSHTGEKPYKCVQCELSFSQKGHLTSHMRIHTGEKPYECTVCKKSFGRLDYLTQHKIIHTGEKPYACDECDKRFTRSTHLTSHKRVHT